LCFEHGSVLGVWCCSPWDRSLEIGDQVLARATQSQVRVVLPQQDRAVGLFLIKRIDLFNAPRFQEAGGTARSAEARLSVTRLTVIDSIGNHRAFLLKIGARFDLGPGPASRPTPGRTSVTAANPRGRW
jgi:hypothetical protein